ncbi:hypothetical protein GALMADRAFT_147216 [Galerina marginata CBS 339.88]|uniref:Peroxidase n=1 Tax=Galerina marginata (strain CBS 339.88) TaxID=685588 RepID=A0A067S9E6_GALM3|nr:hypothetical protein GALMADRAFT_147216 [Galerina marginata CBS 339.88]
MSFGRLAVLVVLLASHLAAAVTCPGGQVVANKVTSLELFPVIKLLQADLFDGGECGEEAHAALRLAFHDAIGFSTSGGKGGGADGSILAFNKTETKYAANDGIDDIVAAQWPIFLQSNLSAGDFVHLAGAIGTGNCPGAPLLPYSMGRPPPVAPAPDLTVPQPTDSVTKILARFADAGFVPAEVIWLLASHSIADANKLDPSIPGTPFDSTPFTFDTQFYLEVLLKGTRTPGPGPLKDGEVLSPLAGEMRLKSDFAFSQDNRTACFWQEAINDQPFIMARFHDAMQKLQLLGQTGLTDCSDAIPVPKTFAGPIKYPASFSQANLKIACLSTPFPSIATVAGPAPTIPPVSGASDTQQTTAEPLALPFS